MNVTGPESHNHALSRDNIVSVQGALRCTLNAPFNIFPWTSQNSMINFVVLILGARPMAGLQL